MRKLNLKLGMALVLMLSACIDRDITPNSGSSDDIQDLVVPQTFDFTTTQTIDLTITEDDNEAGVRYDIYTLSSDTLNGLVTSGFSDQGGQYSTRLVIPNYLEKLYIKKNRNGQFESMEVELNSDQVGITFKSKPGGRFSRTENCSELLYAVNGDGGFYTIDNESGIYDEVRLSDLEGGGSIACAVDRANRIVYYNTGNTLRYYDIDEATFHVQSQGNPFNGSYPRMEYNNSNGLLYIAKNERMYIIDPLTNTTISSYNIVGLESPVGGGDMAISLDGTIFMCAFSGLYRIEVVENEALATRISADNLPFSPTSMAIDRTDRLYLATNAGSSELIEMDKVDGAWQVAQAYNHKINDLGSLPCTIEELGNTDTDGDGIIDPLDDFPQDADKAYETFTPSEFGWGSLAFEDLWPFKGDYDFNDLVVNYRFIGIANAQNEFVELEARFRIKAIGASFRNGFGFEMPISSGLISSVTGHRLTQGIVTLDGKGLESGQTNPVIIVFDNAFDNIGRSGGAFVNTETAFERVEGDEIVINIAFTQPVPSDQFGSAPFNPFIFIDGERNKEVHLADMAPTDLADTTLLGTASDDSNIAEGRFYKSENGLPWAINIIHDFKYPIEKTAVNAGYNRFNDWATSGGVQFPDWYKDNSGYRNNNRLYDR
ncbi:MAG: LruC domain-containing protein [Bacteroidota bacterium]